MSTYFDESSNRVPAGSLARSTQVNDLRDNTGGAFDMLPEPDELAQSTANLGVDSGAANAYVLTMPTTMTSYETGNELVFIPANANTGASVVNADGLGNKALKRPNGDDLAPGDLLVDTIYSFRYNGTVYQFVGFSSTESSAAAAAASASAAAASAAAAAASETAAETAETNAETAETNAETAETNAAASAAAAAASAADLAVDYIIKVTGDSPYTASHADQILADITGGNLTIEFPATPSNNDWVKLVKIGSISTGNVLTLDENGESIMGAAENFIVDLDDVPLMFVYKSSTSDWRIAI